MWEIKACIWKSILIVWDFISEIGIYEDDYLYCNDTDNVRDLKAINVTLNRILDEMYLQREMNYVEEKLYQNNLEDYSDEPKESKHSLESDINADQELGNELKLALTEEILKREEDYENKYYELLGEYNKAKKQIVDISYADDINDESICLMLDRDLTYLINDVKKQTSDVHESLDRILTITKTLTKVISSDPNEEEMTDREEDQDKGKDKVEFAASLLIGIPVLIEKIEKQMGVCYLQLNSLTNSTSSLNSLDDTVNTDDTMDDSFISTFRSDTDFNKSSSDKLYTYKGKKRKKKSKMGKLFKFLRRNK